jgi:hypothetical protein
MRLGHADCDMHSMRTTKARLICRRTRILRAVQLVLRRSEHTEN